MDVATSLMTVFPLSLTAGINLYGTILIVGLSIRLGWVTNVPAGLTVLGHEAVIIVAGVLYLVEFLADKIPFVDNIWDIVHTVIRPLGAALVAAAALGNVDPVVAVIAALVAGGVALAAHGGKASGRAAINVASPAENVSNIAVSVAEDVGVAVLAYFALKYPLAAAIVAGILLVLIVVLVPRIVGWSWFTLRTVFARIKGWVRKVERPDALPAAHMPFLDHRLPELAARCKAQKVPGARGRYGYLALRAGDLFFTYNTWLGIRCWQADRDDLVSAYLRRRLLLDVLEVYYRDPRKEKPRVARFLFMKDRSPLAEQFLARLRGLSPAGVAAAAEQVCLGCGRALRPDDRYCPQCGRPVPAQT